MVAGLAPAGDGGVGHSHAGGPSRYAYVSGCRHPDCVKANRAYQSARLHGQNRPDEAWVAKVPAGAARRHLAQLAANGVGLSRVSKATGVARSTLVGVLGKRSVTVAGDGSRVVSHSGGVRRISPELARAILGVTPDGGWVGKVDCGPTRALIDDLVSEGYSRSTLAAMLGVTWLPSIGDDLVSARLASQVAALHERLLGDVSVVPFDAPDVDPGAWWAPPTGDWALSGRCRPENQARRPRAAPGDRKAPGGRVGARAARVTVRTTPQVEASRQAGLEAARVTDLFFPGRGDSAKAAKAVCAGCVVRSECLEYALGNENVIGIWGGTDTEERHRMRAAAARPEPAPPVPAVRPGPLRADRESA